MQLVGQTCIHCRERVTREPDGRFCPKCGSAVHLACSKRALIAAPSGSCRACGAPATKQLAGAREQQNETKGERGYRTILLGVALMIGGILGSMLFSSLEGYAPIAIAGGAVFSGVVLVVVGFLQSTRR
jgi:hypothetical protein